MGQTNLIKNRLSISIKTAALILIALIIVLSDGFSFSPSTFLFTFALAIFFVLFGYALLSMVNVFYTGVREKEVSNQVLAVIGGTFSSYGVLYFGAALSVVVGKEQGELFSVVPEPGPGDFLTGIILILVGLLLLLKE